MSANSFGRALVLAAVCLSAPTFAQDTWYVEQGGRPPGLGTRASPYTSIQYAVDAQATKHGDTITVHPGTYEETIHLNKTVIVASLTGPEATIIDANRQGSVVSIAHYARDSTSPLVSPTLRGFTLTGGSGTMWSGQRSGGGVFAVNATAGLEDCIIAGNRAALGGGVFSDGATLTLLRCTLQDNVAGSKQRLQDGHGGAVYAKGGALGLNQSVVQANKAGRGAGLYLQDARLDLVKSKVFANVTDPRDLAGRIAAGGGLFAHGASEIDARGAEFSQNVAFGQNAKGGAVRLVGGRATFDQCSFSGNVSRDFRGIRSVTGWGAGIAADGGPELLVTNSEFLDNWAPSGGGGAWGVGTYRDCAFRNGRSGFGAGVFASEEGLELTGCILENNEARSHVERSRGGAVYGPAVLNDCVLQHNTAWGDGGGAFGATLNDCTLLGNRAVCPDVFEPAFGGGACESILNRCRVIDNVAAPLIEPLRTFGYGGGVARSRIYRTEVLRNKADRGGGAYDSVIDRSTLASNLAQDAGDGVYFDALARELFIHDSILWNNGQQEIVDVSKHGQDVRFSDVRGGWRGLGNIDADPLFWDAQQLDCHLKPSSLCIDAADPNGRPDPDGTPPDMGALRFDPEHCGQPKNFCSAVMDSRGCQPAIGYEGLPTAQGRNDFRVTASNVINGSTGLLLWSLSRSHPFSGLECYVQCLEPPIVTTPAQRSGGNVGVRDCSGSFSFHFSGPYMTSMGLEPGTTVYCQYWYRDAAGLPPANMGRTDALEFSICPAAN